MDMDAKNSVFGCKKFNEIIFVELDFCISTCKHTRICTFIEAGKHNLNRVLKRYSESLCPVDEIDTNYGNIS